MIARHLTLDRPPSPPLLDILRYAQTDTLALIEQMGELGPVAFTPVGVAGRPTYWFFEPEAIEHILVRNRKNYQKDPIIQRLRAAIGNGLLVSEGDEWKAQRRTMAPSFHHRALRGYSEAMIRRTDDLISAWHDGDVVELNDEMMRLTLRIVLDCLFGTDIGEDEEVVSHGLDAMMEYYAVTIPRLLQVPLWVPTSLNRRFQAAIRSMDQVVFRIIAERRRSGEQRSDLLGMLLAAYDDVGNPMPDHELRDQVLTLMLAGHETTAQTLTYTLWLLDRNPEIASLARSSVLETIGDEQPSFENMGRLSYLTNVVTESMRLYPPAAVMGRLSIEEDEILGWKIPAGSQVTMPQWAVHRDPRFYPNPSEFRPERWTDEMREALPKFAFFPFGGGNRVCIGDRFAMMEAVLVLARLLQKVEIRDIAQAPLTLSPSVTLRPGNDIPVRIAKR